MSNAPKHPALDVEAASSGEGAQPEAISGDGPTFISLRVASAQPATNHPSGVGPGLPPEASQLPEIGRDRYAIVGEFAHGGIGRILQARDVRLDRPVALKELLEPGGPAEARFVTEALVTARLQHPSIVPIYEAGRWPTGEPFYAMKLVSGRPLSQVIAGAPQLDERLALLPHVLAVAEAMAYAHSERIVHRDLKPANILVGEFGETVVIDWGLAKDLSQQDSAPAPAGAPTETLPPRPLDSELTLHGTVVGTPAYMPPEQAAGLKVDARADVYALGAILYHLLAGTQPYDAATPQGILQQVVTTSPTPLAQRQKGIPEELLDIVAKAMARDPADRYPTARELAEDLRRFQAGQLVGAHRYSPLDRLRRFIRRHRATLAAAAAALVTVAVLGTASVRRILAERDRAEAARREAVERADALTLVNAREALDRDPNEALGWLKGLSPAFDRWGLVRIIAADARSRGLATVLRGHSRFIGHLAFSPDGRLLATASDDKTVRLWDLERGEARVLTGHTDEVWWLAFSPDGRLLSSGSKDRTVRVWDVATGAAARVFTGHLDGPVRLFFSPDGKRVISGGRDGTVRLWDLATGSARILGGLPGRGVGFAPSPDGRYLATSSRDQNEVLLWDLEHESSRLLTGHHAPVVHVAFSPRGDVFATGGDDAEVRLWRVEDGRSRLLAGHRDKISGLAFSPDGKLLASAGADATVRLWDIGTGQARVLEGHRGTESPLAFSPDGKLLAFGSQDRTVRLWDLSTGLNRVLRGFKEGVQTLAFSPDGRLLAAGDANGAVRVFGVTADTGRVLAGHEGAVASAEPSPDGRQVVSTGQDGTVRLWDLSGGEPRVLRGHAQGALYAVFSPDGAWVASVGADRTMRLWDRSGRQVRLIEGYEELDGYWSPPLAFSPDGGQLAAGLADGTVRLREPRSGRERVLAGHGKAIRALAFSPDGARLASAGMDSTVRLWDVAAGTERMLGAHEGPVRVVAFSPDGRHLVSGSLDHTLRIWDVESGASLRVDAGVLGVRQLAFSPDGRTAFTLGVDEAVVRRWDVETGEPRGPFRGHEGSVVRFALSHDGKRLATASADTTVRLWDVESGESRILRGHTGKVTWVAFSPDDRQVVSAGEDGTVRLWQDDLPSGAGPLRAWLETAETRGAR